MLHLIQNSNTFDTRMTEKNQENNQKEKFSKVVPIWKFILLSVITFKIYEIGWFSKNIEFATGKKDLKIFSFWYIFLGINALILYIFLKLPDPYSLLALLSCITTVPLVHAMNRYWKKEEQNLPLKKLSFGQILLIILGIIILILLITVEEPLICLLKDC